MTLTKNANGTYTVSLTNKETAAVTHGETVRGSDFLTDQFDAIFRMLRKDLRAYEEDQMVTKYDALPKAQRDAIDAILATAVVP